MAKSQTMNKNHLMPYYIITLPPFDWKLFKLGLVSVRDIRKNVPILQVGGSTPAPPTLPVIRVVLLHTERIIQYYLSSTVRIYSTIYLFS